MIEWLRERSAQRGEDAPSHSIELSGTRVPIELRRHARAKRLTLRLAPHGGAVQITLPRWCAASDAVAFAADRREWLEAQLAKIPATEDPLARGTLRYRGASLAIAWNREEPRRPALTDGTLRLGGPQETVARRLQRWLEGEALRLMDDDLAHYCALAGIAVPELRLTRARKRWGSCSAEGTVRINWRLVQAPDHVRRSVVAHETAHLVHFDHSPQFHGLLGELYEGNIEDANAWLRGQGRTLYCDFG